MLTYVGRVRELALSITYSISSFYLLRLIDEMESKYLYVQFCMYQSPALTPQILCFLISTLSQWQGNQIAQKIWYPSIFVCRTVSVKPGSSYKREEEQDFKIIATIFVLDWFFYSFNKFLMSTYRHGIWKEMMNRTAMTLVLKGLTVQWLRYQLTNNVTQQAVLPRDKCHNGKNTVSLRACNRGS